MSSPPPATFAANDRSQVMDSFFSPDGERERSSSVSSSTSDQFSPFKQELQPEPTPTQFMFQPATQYPRQLHSTTLSRSTQGLVRTSDAPGTTYISPFSRPGPRVQTRNHVPFPVAPREQDSISRPIDPTINQVRYFAGHVGGAEPPASREASPHVASAPMPHPQPLNGLNQTPQPIIARLIESHRVQRDEDVIELMWKKVKERERELELKVSL